MMTGDKRTNFLTIIILVLLILSALCVSAQKQQNELSIYSGGGLATFCFQPLIKNASSMGYGGDAGVGFTGFISPHWGIYIGAGAGIFNVKNNINNFIFITPKQEDCEGYLYDLYTTLNGYKETHKAIFLSIPLMLQFQTKMGHSLNWRKNKRVGYYAMAGAKALFLFSNNYTSEITSLYNTAYYPEFDNWINSLPILGLGPFDGHNTSGKLKFGILAMVTFETGAKWRIGKNLFLYTGIYFDYGLNDPNKKKRKVPESFTWALPEEFENFTLLKFTNRINLMTVGLKLRLALMQPPIREPCHHY